MQKDKEGHIIPAEKKSYNDRLFRSGPRKYFHEARFFWLRKKLQSLKIEAASVLELGCYDGKLLAYLPFTPFLYHGYDANWEDGLDLAKTKWSNEDRYHFFYSNTPESFNPQAQVFDVSVCMETLEHLPLSQLDLYLQKLSASTLKTIFITLPNEKGPLFLIKYAIKKIFLKVDEPYSMNELFHASLGNLYKVERVEFGHKGFDYQLLAKKLEQYFRVDLVEPIPFSYLPAWMNFSIGIIASPRQ